ncbi:hypothetical protein CBR_g20255 [Chara braunii]|uniref:Uncharacterized protein n=1 Tax=Chara braunii TaxID=69332 RepID=A0A388KZZ8_CHABU|nr:hypothetical protein CBR_g20255 [Chara braunii]|eukprot:GBG75625.1 hypothetical protein CBR_g20255 [Chara braunii]
MESFAAVIDDKDREMQQKLEQPESPAVVEVEVAMSQIQIPIPSPLAAITSWGKDRFTSSVSLPLGTVDAPVGDRNRPAVTLDDRADQDATTQRSNCRLRTPDFLDFEPQLVVPPTLSPGVVSAPSCACGGCSLPTRTPGSKVGDCNVNSTYTILCANEAANAAYNKSSSCLATNSSVSCAWKHTKKTLHPPNHTTPTAGITTVTPSLPPPLPPTSIHPNHQSSVGLIRHLSLELHGTDDDSSDGSRHHASSFSHHHHHHHHHHHRHRQQQQQQHPVARVLELDPQLCISLFCQHKHEDPGQVHLPSRHNCTTHRQDEPLKSAGLRSCDDCNAAAAVDLLKARVASLADQLCRKEIEAEELRGRGVNVASVGTKDSEEKLLASEWAVERLEGELERAKEMMCVRERNELELGAKIESLEKGIKGREKELQEMEEDMERACEELKGERAKLEKLSLLLTTLERDIKERTEREEKHVKEKSELQAGIDQKTAEVARLKRDVECYADSEKSMRTLVDGLKMKLKEFMLERDEQGQEKKAAEHVKKANERVARLEEKVLALEQILDRLRHKEESSHKELSRLREELGKRDAELRRLREQSAVCAERERIQAEMIDDQRGRMRAQESRLDVERREKGQLAKKLQEAHGRQSDLEDELMAARQLQEVTRKTVEAQAREEVARLTGLVEDRESRIAELQEEVGRCCGLLEEEKRRNERLTDVLGVLESQVAIVKGREETHMAALERLVKDVQEKNRMLMRHAEESAREMREQREVYTQLEREMQRSRERARNVEESLIRVHRQGEAKDREMARQKVEIAELNHELADVRDKLDRREEDVKRLRDKIEAISEIPGCLRKTQAMVERIDREMKVAEERWRCAVHRGDNLSMQLQAMEWALEAKGEELLVKQDELSEKETQMEELMHLVGKDSTDKWVGEVKGQKKEEQEEIDPLRRIEVKMDEDGLGLLRGSEIGVSATPLVAMDRSPMTQEGVERMTNELHIVMGRLREVHGLLAQSGYLSLEDGYTSIGDFSDLPLRIVAADGDDDDDDESNTDSGSE